MPTLRHRSAPWDKQRDSTAPPPVEPRAPRGYPTSHVTPSAIEVSRNRIKALINPVPKDVDGKPAKPQGLSLAYKIASRRRKQRNAPLKRPGWSSRLSKKTQLLREKDAKHELKSADTNQVRRTPLVLVLVTQQNVITLLIGHETYRPSRTPAAALTSAVCYVVGCGTRCQCSCTTTRALARCLTHCCSCQWDGFC